jgi:gamma-glutamylcyclotransferase (GGCT)/AIG2-like uncharacterized protein YtfP
MSHLFVYGTLKRGYLRAPALAGQRFVEVARTAERYRMFDCGEYPGLVERDGGLSIVGELYEVDAECLKRLDVIEEVDHGLYRRAAVELLAPHADVVAETYLYCRGTAGMRDCGTNWP